MLRKSCFCSLDPPLLTSQQARPIEISAAPVICPSTTDCDEDNVSPNSNSTTNEGAKSSAAPVPTSTNAITTSSSFDIGLLLLREPSAASYFAAASFPA